MDRVSSRRGGKAARKSGKHANDKELQSAIRAVKDAPDREDLWDKVEELASGMQRPDDVADLYRGVLDNGIDRKVALKVGKRAAAFFEEWYGDSPDELASLLGRVLSIDPGSKWAFERLTVALTVAERWDELLSHYDTAIEAAKTDARRITLLEEATQVARDVAGKTDAAIGYMKTLARLKPDDAALAGSLERLLERHDRWRDLVELLSERCAHVDEAERVRTRERIAELWLDKLDDPTAALEELSALLDESTDDKGACALLERILHLESAPADARRRALGLLKSRYDVGARDDEVVRILEASLGFAPEAEALDILREIAERLARAGRANAAMSRYAELLQRSPENVHVRDELRHLAETSGQHEAHAAALVQAAEAAAGSLKVSLLHEAAAVRQTGVDDADGAVELYERILSDAAADASTRLAAARSLNALLDRAERRKERLEVLERLAELEPVEADRRSAVAQAARLADRLGAVDHALALWERILSEDPEHREALDASVDLLERAGRHQDLIRMLRRRSGARVGPHQRRADLERVAALYADELGHAEAAIEVWKEIAGEFGEDKVVVEALARLYAARGQHRDVAETLARASGHEGRRQIDVLCRLADLEREPLGQLESAAAHYEQALALDPRCEAARRGLGVLLGDPSGSAGGRGEGSEPRTFYDEASTRRRAAEALARAYRTAGEPARLVELTDVRLADLEHAADKAAVLKETAEIQERILDDEAAALRSLSRALVIDPEDPALHREVARLVHETGAWSVGAQTYRDACEAGPSPRRVAALRFDEGVAREKSDDPSGAAEAYASVLAVAPDRIDAAEGLVRAAERAGRLDLAVTTLRATAFQPGTPARLLVLLAELQRRAPGPDLVETLIALADRSGNIDALEEAARASLVHLEDSGRQTQLLERLHRLAPERFDADLLEALARRLSALERLPEVLEIKKRQLEEGVDAERRRQLRLEIAQVAGEIEARAGRVQMLLVNLEEEAGHPATVDALTGILTAGRRFEELADVLSVQAARLEEGGEGGRAARLWEQVARLCEGQLGDIPRALESYRKVASLDPSVESLEALARLHTERGEHAAAASWLEKRMDQAEGDERVAVALRLAEALAGAARIEKAVSVLERARRDRPEDETLRLRLADLYRQTEEWGALAALLVDACAHTRDDEARLEMAREAALLYSEKLGTPEGAVDVLLQVTDLAPDDGDLKRILAQGLANAGRLEEAREVLSGLIAGFGRRRSKERAAIHVQAAEVARALGDLKDALSHLEQASKMDMSRPQTLRVLAQTAREAGDAKRAESAYRALLLVVRRRGAEEDGPTAAEVLYELSHFADERGDAEQAKETLESALEEAVQSDAAARRFSAFLLDRDEGESALSILDRRLQSEDADPAPLLADRAAVLTRLGRDEEAFDAWLSAIEKQPGEKKWLAAARALASKLDGTAAYADRLQEIADGLRRKEDAVVASELLLHLGRISEEELDDPERAAELYRRVEAFEVRRIDALGALARVTGEAGDRDEQMRALAELVKLTEDGAPGAAAALYSLAELQLGRKDTLDEGLVTLDRALTLEPRHAQAAAMLTVAADAAPDHDGVLERLERAARQSGEPQVLLDFLERRARHPAATPQMVKEAVDLARRLDQIQRAEALLERAVEAAQATSGNVADAAWALEALADTRRSGGDLAGAADALDQLLAVDPTRESVWRPLLEVCVESKDLARLAEVAPRLLNSLLEPGHRNEVRMAQARALLEAGRTDDAIACLKDVLQENPDHAEATERLLDLYEKDGRDEELGDLLWRQLDGARDRGDADLTVSLSLRVARLLSGARPEDATSVLKQALLVAPDDPRLLTALLEQLSPEADARDRAELLEKLIPSETGDAAVGWTLEAADLYTGLEDHESARRVLTLGHRQAPGHPAVRGRLEKHYRDTEDWASLAELLMVAATGAEDPAEAVPLFREAATLFRDTLGRPAEGAGALSQAARVAPNDIELLSELAACHAAAGNHRLAVDDLSGALESGALKDEDRLVLLRVRADLFVQLGETAEAAADLEAAYELSPQEVAEDLGGVLESVRRAQAQRGDAEGERSTTFRLLALYDGDERAVALLREWIDGNPTDREALHRALELEESAGNWEQVAALCARLASLEQGEAQVEVALRMAAACEQVGNPGGAQTVLEHVLESNPGEPRLLDKLKAVYQAEGAHRPLADLLIQQADALDDAGARAALYLEAGSLLLHGAGDTEAALPILGRVVELSPENLEVAALLADAHIAAGRFDKAVAILTPALESQGKKRTPEVAALQLRMANVAAAQGDQATQLEWLKVAFESDRKNGQVAADLANLAMALQDDEIALKVLRAISIMNEPCPISRVEAYLRQGRIAARGGDLSRAELWAKKALREDPGYAEAQRFLEEIGKA